MKNKKVYLELFLSLFKIGLFTFGGGYAMISLLENEFVEKKKWIDHDEFMNVVVISESTPGPIAINSATYIGYKVGKVWGSLLATLGVCIPSFVIIYLISLFFDKFMTFAPVAAAFRGIQACVVYLIFSAGFKMLKKMKKKPLPVILVSLTILCMVMFSLFAINFKAIYYIIIGGVVGISVYLVKQISKGVSK